MQSRTISLRTFLIVVGLLGLVILFGFSRLRIQIVPATVDAATPLLQERAAPLATLPQNSGLPTQELLSGIYEVAVQSVVNIDVRQQSRNTWFQSSPYREGGTGTGWVWDEEGHIVTNNHVVEGAQDITVNFANGMWAKAELVARDSHADLAVIRVLDIPQGLSLRPLERATTSLRVGHYTLVLGSPFGLDNSMSLGIVSALGRGVAVGSRYSLPEVIQTDAAMNPGNSGGPLLNLNGKVVGINFAIRSPDRINSGVGFAIPISVANRVIPALISDGVYNYPFLGIQGGSITGPLAEQQRLDSHIRGVYVSQVLRGGPAAQANLRADDIIVSIDGLEVRNYEDLISYLIAEKSPGDTVEIGVWRNGRNRTFAVELTSRPDPAPNSRVGVTVGEAGEIAKEAVADEIQDVRRTSVRNGLRDGNLVWIVTLEGEGKRATVIIDASSGEVLSESLESGR